jgi:hypothetical protein
MDCPEGTVAKRIHSAHRKLQQALAGTGLLLGLSSVTQALESVPKVEIPSRLAEAIRGLAFRAAGVPAGMTLGPLLKAVMTAGGGGLRPGRRRVSFLDLHDSAGDPNRSFQGGCPPSLSTSPRPQER